MRGQLNHLLNIKIPLKVLHAREAVANHLSLGVEKEELEVYREFIAR